MDGAAAIEVVRAPTLTPERVAPVEVNYLRTSRSALPPNAPAERCYTKLEFRPQLRRTPARLVDPPYCVEARRIWHWRL